MADANEDVPGPLPGNPVAGDDDLDDEVQDFRFLSALSNAHDPSRAKIPRRGAKEFEPHGSDFQNTALEASRQAMHDALQGERLHQPRSLTVGYYDEATGSVLIPSPKGQLLRTMGKGTAAGLVLKPEEGLYLLERGSLEIRWVVEDGASEVHQGEAGGGKESTHSASEEIVLSLQAAYALLIGQQHLTLDRYLVYAGLKRSGYTVLRASEWSEPSAAHHQRSVAAIERKDASSWSLLRSLFGRLSIAREEPPLGPLVRPGLYRNYQEVYRRLAVIPFHHPASPPSPSSAPESDYSDSQIPQVLYHVYKPSPSFAKSRPGPPDFYVAIVSARETVVPTLSELDGLFADTPLACKPTHPNRYARLKLGWQSVIIAVVDAGVISYLKFGEAVFGEEKLFEDFGKQKQKGIKGKGGPRGKLRK